MNDSFSQKSLYSLGLVTLVSLGVSAPAQGLTLTQQQTLTDLGRTEANFSFTAPASDGTDGVLNLANALGSTFDLTIPLNYFDVVIEGTNLGSYSCSSNPIVANAIVMDCGGTGDFNTFSQDIVLQGDALETWLADELLEVDVRFSNFVEAGFNGGPDGIGPADLVATLTYDTVPTNAVPTPAAVLPVLSGLLAAARQEKKKYN